MLQGLVFGDEPMTSSMQSSIDGFSSQVASELRSAKGVREMQEAKTYPPGITKAAKKMAQKAGEPKNWEKYADNMVQMQKGTDVEEPMGESMNPQAEILESAIRQQRRQCLNFDNGSHLYVEYLPVTKRFHLGERHDAFNPDGYDSAAQVIQVAEQHRGSKVIQIVRG